MTRLFWMVIYLALPSQIFASVGVVEMVREKAALQRQGGQHPLIPQTELEPGDIITTGDEARVVIRLANQSVIRLGEHTRFQLEQFASADEIWKGVFNVIKGIFRFTAAGHQKYDVKVQVGKAIGLGIRGTDVFAKATWERDLVCLIEGRVMVQAGAVQAVLTQPRQFFVVPKNQPPLPVELVGEEKFQEWLKNTE